MMGVYAADGAEIMPRRARVELVDLEKLRALDHMQPAERNARHDRILAPTVRTIAPSGIHHTVGEIQLQHDRTAMARRTVSGRDDGATYLLQLYQNSS